MSGKHFSLTRAAGLAASSSRATRAGLLAATALGGAVALLVPAGAMAATPCSFTTTSAGAGVDLMGVSCVVATSATTAPTLTATNFVTNSGSAAAVITIDAPNLQNTPFPGAITDGASTTGLTLIGGAITLSGTSNTYSGPTTITSGTIYGGAANAFSPNSTITVQTGGTLDFGGYTQTVNTVSLAGGTAQNGTLAGVINSTGGFINNLTINTPSTVSTRSITTLSGTTVLTGSNFALGLPIVQGGTLEVDGTFEPIGTSTVVNGPANNGAAIVGIAPGVAGTTAASAAPSTSGYLMVEPGGTLAGSGNIGYVAVLSGGTLAPGAAGTTGTLTINGSLVFSAGSTYQVNASPTLASSTYVNGTAFIGGGTVSILANGSFAQPTYYKILTTTQGITGSFNTVSINSNFAFLNPTLSYDGNNAYLTLNSNGTTLPQIANSPNTGSVGGILNAVGQSSQLYKAFGGLSAQQAQNALNSISGEGNTSTQTAGQVSTRVFTSFIGDRAAPGEGNTQGTVQVSGGGLPAGTSQYAPVEPQAVAIVVDRPKPTPLYRVFATGFGGGNTTEAVGAATAAETGSFYGGLMGIDYRVQPNILIGAAAGGSASNFLVAARSSSGSTTGFNGNVFGVVSFGPWYAQSLTTFSTFANSTTRNIAGFGGLSSAVEKANFSSFEARTRAEFGRVIPVNTIKGFENFKVTPFVALELAQLTTDPYSEYNATGGSNVFNLTSYGRTYADVRSFLGARLETSFDAGNGITIRPIARLSYVHSFSPAPTSINTFQSVPGATFTVAGAPVAHNSAETKIGAEADIGHGTVIFANFEGNFSTIEQIYGGRGGVRYRF